MKMLQLPKLLATILLMATVFLANPLDAAAHCDTMDGPVVMDASTALETGDLDPVLKWVTPHDEAEVTSLFERTMRVREGGEEARELADMYFFETVVRLHRASEGVAFTGIKPAGSVDPAIAAADIALETGSVDELSDMLVGDLQAALDERFSYALEAKAHAGDSVEAGREFVRAYVLFTHLAEEISHITRHASDVHATHEDEAANLHADAPQHNH